MCARLQECEHQGEDGEGSDLGHCRSGAVPRHHERVSWHHSDLFHAWQALQALVMDTLPPATAMIDSIIGLEKLPANGHSSLVAGGLQQSSQINLAFLL